MSLSTSKEPVLNGQTDLKLRSRVIILYDEIDDVSVVDTIRDIITINEDDDEEERKFISSHNSVPTRKPIILEIQSGGGAVRDGFALIAAIEQSKTKVITRVNGYAFSMALTVFLAGHERHMSRHASLMYHQLSTGGYGTLKNSSDRIEISKELQEQIDNYILERTNWKRPKLSKIYKLQTDYYISSDEALESGFATKIV